MNKRTDERTGMKDLDTVKGGREGGKDRERNGDSLSIWVCLVKWVWLSQQTHFNDDGLGIAVRKGVGPAG